MNLLMKIFVLMVYIFSSTKEQAMYLHYPKDTKYKSWYDNGQLDTECVYKNG